MPEGSGLPEGSDLPEGAGILQTAAAKTEVRVQGIGNLDFYDALGDPDIAAGSRRVQVADPPPMPDHGLRIVNWSRANREITNGIAWYLAFPFTLTNFVGYMQPSATRPSRLLTVVSTVSSVLLTLSAWAWMVVLAESVAVRLPSGGFSVAGDWIVCGVAAALIIVVMVGRRSVAVSQANKFARDAGGSPPSDRVSWLTLSIHSAAVVALAVFVLLTQPARWRWEGWPSVRTPTPDGGFVYRLDAMTALVVVTVLLVLLGGALLVIRSWFGRVGDAPRVLGAAGLVLMTSLCLLHTGLDLFRMVVVDVIGYVAYAFGAAIPHGPASEALLLAYDDPTTLHDNRLDFLPAHAVLFLGIGVATAAVVARRFGGPGLWALLHGRAEGYRWLHDLMGDLPRLLRWGLPLAGVLMLAASYAGISWLESIRSGPVFPLLLIVINALAALAVLMVLFAQFRGLRRIIGRISDIAGFWPVKHHPLAGLSYRDAVVDGIRKEVHRLRDDQVVLVGHSQGSVLCAWLLAEPPPRPAGIQFVSCGSPLGLLYPLFFPTQFPPEMLTRVRENVAGWMNFWRRTDPLADPIEQTANTVLPDPRPGHPLHVHEDYWTDPAQMAYIAALAPPDMPQVSDSAHPSVE